MTTLRFKGIEVEFADGVTRTCPPLTLRVMQVLQDRLAAYTGGNDPANVELVVDAAFSSLSRNYPELKRDEMLDLIDIGNMAHVMSAVMGVSLLVKKGGDEPGEATATDSTGRN